jgi:Zn ribbon nucleic-acid-binding protein
MACFCGCETYEKNEDGFKIACVKCGHGPQNHNDEFRNHKVKNVMQTLDNYSPIILTKTLFGRFPSNSP